MKKNHHFIPVFYQKLYSPNNISIGKYIIDRQKHIPYSNIKKTGYIEYLYGKTTDIEDALMEIESKASRAILRIIETGKIPDFCSEDYQIILLFVLIMDARVLKQADAMDNFIDVQMKMILQMKIEHDMVDMRVEDLDRVKMHLEIPNLYNIEAAFSSWEILLDLKMCLICNDTDRVFITSDNPVVKYNCMYNVRGYTNRNYGLGNMGIQIIFPISPRICIYIYDNVMYDNKPAVDNNFHIERAKEIDKINRLIYMNSYDFLLFHPSTKESYLENIIRGNCNLKNNPVEIAVFGSKDDKFIMNGCRTVRHRFDFSFCRINKNLLNLSFPQHIGGPIRPRAKRFTDKTNK